MAADKSVDVFGRDAAAVKDSYRRRALRTESVADRFANHAVDERGLRGGGRAAGADGPDRLVGDDRARNVACVEPRKTVLRLAQDDRRGVAVVVLLLGFSDAQDRHQAMLDRGEDLAIYQFVGLAADVAALGVAEDYVGDANRLEHRRGDLAGERALVFVMHILRGQRDVRSGELLRSRRERDGGRRDQHVAVARERRRFRIDLRPKRADELARLGRREIHLPVSGEHLPAHRALSVN